MFLDRQAVIFFLIMEILFGSAIGMAGAALLYRRRLTPGVYLKNIALGAFGYLTGSYLAAWADQHAYFVDGRRMDMAPWGEHLWLRNRLAENPQLTAIMTTALLIMIGYLLRRRQKTSPSP